MDKDGKFHIIPKSDVKIEYLVNPNSPSEGRIIPLGGSNYQYEYTIKDHLGNARLTFADLNANSIVDVPGDILQENHYYPFGMSMSYGWMNNTGLIDNRYQYNGKELNDDFGLNWNDYGARWYDAAVGRFPSVDPIINKFPYLTPYNYASNSPVAKIDLYGLQGGFFNEVKEAAVSALGSGLGTATAIVEDVTGADLPAPDPEGTFGQAFQTGEQMGHAGMVLTGTLEMGIGAAEMAVGVAATPATAGVSLAISAKGAAVATHGSFVVQNALRNMSKNKN